MPRRSSSNQPEESAKFRVTDEPTVRLPRGARRKRETREKLLSAAFQLIAERGVDGVAINEITEAADVGFGSFYNHFQSKEEIHFAVLSSVLDEFGIALATLTSSIDDPAVRIAVSVRHAIRLAGKVPLWGRLFLREWHQPEAFSVGLGPRLLADITAGIASKRFDVSDPLLTLIVAGGTIVGSIAVQVGLAGESTKQLEVFGMSGQELDRRAASMLLHCLGLRSEEATVIAAEPLPTLDWTPTFGPNEGSRADQSIPWEP